MLKHLCVIRNGSNTYFETRSLYDELPHEKLKCTLSVIIDFAVGHENKLFIDCQTMVHLSGGWVVYFSK